MVNKRTICPSAVSKKRPPAVGQTDTKKATTIVKIVVARDSTSYQKQFISENQGASNGCLSSGRFLDQADDE